jgi:hypothetical protein
MPMNSGMYGDPCVCEVEETGEVVLVAVTFVAGLPVAAGIVVVVGVAVAGVAVLLGFWEAANAVDCRSWISA